MEIGIHVRKKRLNGFENILEQKIDEGLKCFIYCSITFCQSQKNYFINNMFRRIPSLFSTPVKLTDNLCLTVVYLDVRQI